MSLPDDDVTLRDAADGGGRRSYTEVVRSLASPEARRGLVAVAAGVVLLAWPRLTTGALFAIVGAGLLVVGLSELAAALRQRQGVPAVARGVVMVIAGVVLLFVRLESFWLIAALVGGLLAARGLIDVAGALLHRHRPDWLWRMVRGTGQLLVGVVVAFSPYTILLAAVVALAGSWILSGIVTVIAVTERGAGDLCEGTPEFGDTARDGAPTVVEWLRRQDIGAETRSEIISNLVFEGPALRQRLGRFVALMLFSTVIATLGVETDSTAVVIGAMLVAPLMTPIMATAASLLMGWPVRALRSFATVVLGIALAIGGSWILSKYAPSFIAIDANTQVLGRIQPTLLDLMIAVAAGGAGAYATSRADVSDSLPGVAIAVALVPPLTIVGVSLNAGEFGYAGGALLLFLTNFVGIVAAAGVVFVFVGFSPWFRIEANRDQLVRSFVAVGVALLVVAMPLWLTGRDLISAATERSTVETTVDEWLGPDTAFAVARIDISGRSIDVAIVGAGQKPPPADLVQVLATRLDRPIELDLRVIPENRSTATADPGP